MLSIGINYRYRMFKKQWISIILKVPYHKSIKFQDISKVLSVNSNL